MGHMTEKMVTASDSGKTGIRGSDPFLEDVAPKRSRFFKAKKVSWHGKTVKLRGFPTILNVKTFNKDKVPVSPKDSIGGSLLINVKYVGSRADAKAAFKKLSIGFDETEEKHKEFSENTKVFNNRNFYEFLSHQKSAFSNAAIVSVGVGVAAASALPTMPVLAIGVAIFGGALGYGLTNEIPEE